MSSTSFAAGGRRHHWQTHHCRTLLSVFSAACVSCLANDGCGVSSVYRLPPSSEPAAFQWPHSAGLQSRDMCECVDEVERKLTH